MQSFVGSWLALHCYTTVCGTRGDLHACIHAVGYSMLTCIGMSAGTLACPCHPHSMHALCVPPPYHAAVSAAMSSLLATVLGMPLFHSQPCPFHVAQSHASPALAMSPAHMPALP